MVTLTNDYESDSFVSEMSFNEDKNPVENLRRTLDIQGDKLNQISSNNRELINVQSQLARLRSELEKSEMLRQTLEYELTLLRTQHGKQTAFTHHLQTQFNQANDQIKQLQLQVETHNQHKDNELKEKDKKILELENETETLHERERRIEALNEQIQKMEKTFTDSESLSRKNLAQSILAKERETELKKEYEVIQIKLQYSEQALEQERDISNEAKLNVQLLTNRLSDIEANYESLKNQCKNQERKIDEYQRQCSNEKLLRTTLGKLQSELETKCSDTQKLTIEYEKQLKNIREELANYRRKYRNNEDKYCQIVNKTFEYLRSTRIINETYQTDQNLPTLKQLEELKLHIEQLKTSKVDQTNEISRLKKTIERLNKSSMTQKQIEHETEVNKEKLQIEVDDCREKISAYEESLIRLKRDREHLIKEIEIKSSLINSIQLKFKNLLGKTSINIENDFNDLEKEFKKVLLKSNALEQKLIEKDHDTLLLTQKLEQQVLNLKHDLDQRHQIFLTQKDQLLQRHQNDIQNLTTQLQKMEIRTNEAEHLLNNKDKSTNELIEQSDKFFVILKHLISIWIPLRRRYFQLIDSNRFLKQELLRFNQIKQIVNLNSSIKNRFRIYVITIIALKRFLSFKTNSSIVTIRSSNIVYDQNILSTFNRNFIQNINYDEIFQSLIIQLNRLHSPIQKGSLIKLIAGGLPKSSSYTKTSDLIHSLIVRVDQSEIKIHDKEKECSDLEKSLINLQSEIESRVDYNQFERLCDELQRALDREKQAQELLNEQNNQLKSLTDIIHQTQNEKDFIQEKFNQIMQNEIHSKDKIQHLNKAHQQMDENVKRAEKAIRLVVSDKEAISAYCTRINSVLNVTEKRGVDNVEQLITQLHALAQLPQNFDQKRSPPEMALCQSMALGFVNLLNRLKELLNTNSKDIESLKEHCQMLTEQFRQTSAEEISQMDSSQTIIVQAHPVRVQVNHHPQSAFKPIKPEQHDD
ncbi:unnamed protein product [Adineta steineri]|uniref:Uncharacterized protein n=1 Tax=Adineta steineri TaxID=433720 RepID=A0A819HX32_9BILA|nr:unnamed protein product [Adineta steineri]CAF3910141.1 unnamed protein product [Adineta steineri]